MQAAAPDVRILLTENHEQTAAFLREVLEKGYGRIVSGGGDGTLVAVASAIRGGPRSLWRTNWGIV